MEVIRSQGTPPIPRIPLGDREADHTAQSVYLLFHDCTIYVVRCTEEMEVGGKEKVLYSYRGGTADDLTGQCRLLQL